MAIKDVDPIEAWNFNNSRVGKIKNIELVTDSSPDNYVPGKIGKGWGFENTPASILTADFPYITTDDGFSFSYWIRFPNLTDFTTRTVLELANDSDLAIMYGWARRTSGSQIFGVTSGSKTLTAVGFPNDTDWHYVVAAYSEATGNIALQVDGAALITGTGWLGPAYDVTRIAVGGRHNRTSILEYDMDAVNVWDKKLTDEEMLELWNEGEGVEYPFLAWGSANGDGIVYNGDRIVNLQHPGGTLGTGYLTDTNDRTQIDQSLVEAVPNARFRDARYYVGDTA